METNLKAHWETVFATKQPHEVSWTQETPETSISYFQAANLPKTAKIIDVGGGDSKFVDYLLANDYEDITVLDISKHALDRAKARLGEAAQKVTWIESDINDFQPSETYDFWHDRACFHFLTNAADVDKYSALSSTSVCKQSVKRTGASMARPSKTAAIDYAAAHDLTHGLLERAACPDGVAFVLLRDTGKKGLRLRITKAGGKHWQFETRIKGKLFTRALGEWPAVAIDQAKAEAHPVWSLLSSHPDTVQRATELEQGHAPHCAKN